MNAPLDSFETALLSRLREHVADPQPAAAPPHPSTRWSLGVAAAVAVTATVAVLPGIGETPAYSVQEGNAGEIIVKVNRPEDAAGLQDALARHGVQADILYLDDQQQCAPGRYTPVGRKVAGMSIGIGSGGVDVTLPPGAVREGETFVMALSGEVLAPAIETNEDGSMDLEGYSSWVEFDVASGPVLPCTEVSSTGS